MTQLASQALIPPSPNRSKRRRLPLRTAVDADFVSSPSKRHEAKEFLMYADTPEAKIVASNLKELWSPTDDNSYQKHSPVKVGTPTTHRESAQSQQFSKRPQNLMERLNAIETESLIDITMHSIVPRNIDDMFKASSKDQFGKRILGFQSFDNDSDDEATESVAVVEKAMERVEIHETVDFKQEENIEVQPTQESLQELNKNENETEGEASAEIKEALDIETALQDNHLPSTNYSPQDEIPTIQDESGLLDQTSKESKAATVLIPLSDRIQGILGKRKQRYCKKHPVTLKMLRNTGALCWVVDGRDSDPRKKGLGDIRMKRLRHRAGFKWVKNGEIEQEDV